MDGENKKVMDQETVSNMIVELQGRVTDLELIINNLHGFIKNQIQINEFFRCIIDAKYSKEELLEIRNKYEKMHKDEEKSEKKDENS